MDIRVGATPISKVGIFEVHGTVTNVSSSNPASIKIPNFIAAGTITRIAVRDISQNNNPETIIELFNSDPTGTIHTWNRYYKRTFNTPTFRDDYLHTGDYISYDEDNSIWLVITPTGSTSNNFEYFIMGREGVKK